MDWKKALSKTLKAVSKFMAAPGALDAKLADAARANDIARATRLIADGAKVDNITYSSQNALNLAVESGSLEMVKLMLSAGGNPNTSVSYCSTTPFLTAVEKGDAAIVSALLAAKADVNTQCARGNTGLLLAVAAKNKTIADLLIENGAKTDVPNRKGWTPLFYAARNGDLEMIGQLLEKGARTDRKEENGYNVLGIAQHYDRMDAFHKIQDFTDAQVPEWRATKDGQVAHVSILRKEGYRLTEVFNFETKQCKIITHNFETRADAIAVKTFAEIGDDAVKVATAQRPAPALQPAVQP